ncbi:MAG TPA: DUF4333 domain-containing protein [Acidimicrobiales bacterium]|nr:DUF4333 domain-containing protein [Acidimicrobiales bacterium]
MLVLVAGCREPTHIDPRTLAHELPRAVVEDHPEVVDDVVCPGPIDRGAGVETTCAATIGGTPVTLKVTQVDDDGRVRVELDRTLLDVEKVAADLAARLTKDVGIATTVTCEGPQVRVLTVGDILVCDAIDPAGKAHTFDAKVTDASGTIDLTLR